MQVLSRVNTLVKNKEDWIIALSLIVVLYVAMGIPKLSSKMVKLFSKPVVKFIFLFVVIFLATKNPSLSLILGVALLIIIQTITSHKLVDNLVSKSSYSIPTTNENVSYTNSNIASVQSNQVDESLPKLERNTSVPIGNEKQDINGCDYPFPTELNHVPDSNPPSIPDKPSEDTEGVSGYETGDFAQA
jgi:hypothetical protein